MTDLKPGDAARYLHAECMALKPERRCRECRDGGLAVVVAAILRPPAPGVGGPYAVVREGTGRERAAWPSELRAG